MAQIAAIYRYPVKGLTPEPLTSVKLAAGSTLPADRRYAIENGPSGFDPAAPAHFPKIRFLMLMKNERLARLTTTYDDATETLTVSEGGREVARGDLRTADGRAAIEQFFAAYCADELRGPPKILQAPDHSFSDVSAKRCLGHQSGVGGGARNRDRRAGRSVALSRQYLCQRLAGLAGI